MTSRRCSYITPISLQITPINVRRRLNGNSLFVFWNWGTSGAAAFRKYKIKIFFCRIIAQLLWFTWDDRMSCPGPRSSLRFNNHRGHFHFTIWLPLVITLILHICIFNFFPFWDSIFYFSLCVCMMVVVGGVLPIITPPLNLWHPRQFLTMAASFLHREPIDLPLCFSHQVYV